MGVKSGMLCRFKRGRGRNLVRVLHEDERCIRSDWVRVERMGLSVGSRIRMRLTRKALLVAGKYLDREGGSAEADCETCPAGKLSSAGASSCQSPSCPSNSDAPTGSVTCLCFRGYTGPDGGPCQACGAGTYKDSPGSGACTACQPGEYPSWFFDFHLNVSGPVVVSRSESR